MSTIQPVVLPIVWNWDDGTTQGWIGRVVDFQLYSEEFGAGSIQASSPLLPANLFRSKFNVSFDLTITAFDGAVASDLDLAVDACGPDPITYTYCSIGRQALGPSAAFGVKQNYSVTLAPYSELSGDSEVFIGLLVGTKGFAYTAHSAMLLDNFKISLASSVPESSQSTLLIAGLCVLVLLATAKRTLKKVSGEP